MAPAACLSRLAPNYSPAMMPAIAGNGSQQDYPRSRPWSQCEHCATSMSPHGAVRLSLQPQGSGTAPVVEGDIGAIVLDIWRPGRRGHIDAHVHVVLLLRHIVLDVEDDFPARLQVLGAPLFLEHGRERGVIDVGSVPRGVGGIGAIQREIRFPG